MTPSEHRGIHCFRVLAIAAAALSGCAKDQSGSEEASIAWNSPKIQDLRAELQALHEAYPKNIPGDDGKTKYGNLQRTIEESMAWYFEHKANLSVNYKYGANDISPLQNPLFVGKADPEQLPGPNDHFWQVSRTYDPFEKRRATRGALAYLEGTWEVIETNAKSEGRGAYDKSGNDVPSATPVPGAALPVSRSPWEYNPPSFRTVLKGSQFIVRGNIVEWFGPDEIKIDQFRMEGPFNLPVGTGLKPCLMTLSEMPRSAQKRVNGWLKTDELTPRHPTSAIFELDRGTLRLSLSPRGSRQGPLTFETETVLSLRRIPEPPITDSRTAVAQQPGISWGAPKMNEVFAKWQILQNTDLSAPRPGARSPSINERNRRQRLVDRLFQKTFSRLDTLRLAESCDRQPTVSSVPAFEEAVLGFLAQALAEANERQRLVEMFAKRCPTWSGQTQPIEWRLVTAGRRLDQPLLVLKDAYTRCQIPETRAALAAAVRRVFTGLSIAGKSDAEYVQNAMERYEAEKHDLRVNGAYLTAGIDTVNVPLFTKEPIPAYGIDRQRWSIWMTVAIGIALISAIWSVHAAIAVGLSAAVVRRSRGRVDWRFRHTMPALVIPFAVWFVLLLIRPTGISKGPGNLAEPFILALVMPLAAIARVRFSRRAFWLQHSGLLIAVLIALLSIAAAAVYFVVP